MTVNYVIHYESDGEQKKLWLGNVSRDHAELRLAVVKFYKWNKNARLENLQEKVK